MWLLSSSLSVVKCFLFFSSCVFRNFNCLQERSQLKWKYLTQVTVEQVAKVDLRVGKRDYGWVRNQSRIFTALQPIKESQPYWKSAATLHSSTKSWLSHYQDWRSSRCQDDCQQSCWINVKFQWSKTESTVLCTPTSSYHLKRDFMAAIE